MFVQSWRYELPGLPEHQRSSNAHSSQECDLEIQRKDFGGFDGDELDARDSIHRSLQEGDQVYGVSETNDHSHSDRNNRPQKPAPQFLKVVEKRHLAQNRTADDRSFNQE